MEGRKIKILFWFIWIILLFPVAQFSLNLFKEKPLSGAIIKREKPQLTYTGWIDGTYQIEMEPFLNESFGFRPYFIRLNNQIAYSLYNLAKANSVIIGKEENLYELGYINAYFGRDFIGKDSINSVVSKLAYLQSTLSKKNIDLVLVLNPGKVSYVPDYIPDSLIGTKGITNYEYYAQEAKRQKINLLDLRDYFISNKRKFPYPLFPKCGIHWSTYCEILAKDTLMKYLSAIRKVKMPELVIDSIPVRSGLEYRDADIKNGMNVIWGPNCGKLAYPVYHIVDQDRIKINSLVVADSFFWGIYGNTDISKLFNLNSFWFYYKERYDTKFGLIPETTIDLKKEIEKHDMVIVMATESTLPKLGWGFIEDAYQLYAAEEPVHAQNQLLNH